jgi:hypothetical protein
MEYCYRYWAWTTEIQGNEVSLLKDITKWGCTYENTGVCVNIWIPEKTLTFFLLKYPSLKPHPIFNWH